jgi:hypothetical protein
MREDEPTSGNQILTQAIQAVRETPVSAGPPADVIEAVVARLEQAGAVPNPRAAWERIRHMNWMIRFAIAAAVVLAVTFPATWWLRTDSRSGTAFGQVLDHVRSARSVRLHLRIEQKGQPPMDSTLYTSGQSTRQEETSGRVTISNAAAGESLILIPAERKAILTTLAKPHDPNAAESTDPLDLLERLKALREGAEVSLGTQEIDGQTALGFKVQKAGVQWTIWAGARSRLPLRVEYYVPLFEATFVMTDFVFDVAMDPAIFSLTPPTGYAVEERNSQGVWVVTDSNGALGDKRVEVGMDFSTATETDLTDYLRMSADRNGGVFSHDFLLAPVQDATSALTDGQGDKKAQADAGSLVVKYMRAIRYFGKLQAEAERGQVWEVGEGVKLGDASRAILVWKLSGANQYRGVFGDLSIRDIGTEEFQRITTEYKERSRRRDREKGYLGAEVEFNGNRTGIMSPMNDPAEPPVVEVKPGDDLCVVKRVIPGTAAEKAGLKAGDVLVSLDGQPVRSGGEFVRTIGKHRPGERVTLVVRRGKQTVTLEVTLGQRPFE